MKKVLSVILLLSMMLGCASAEGKEYISTLDINGVFELRGTIPEGYHLQEVLETESSRIVNIEAGEDRPLMVLSIAFDEIYADVDRLNDLSSEDRAALEGSFREEDTVTISTTVTDFGTELITVREAEGATEYVSFFTIYKGYEIEFILIAPQNASDGTAPGLTEEQIRMAVQFLSDLDFVPEA